MLVRMKVAVSGTRNGRDWPGVGETVELPDREAAELCQAGMATPVAEDATETATVPDDAEVRKPARRRKASRREADTGADEPGDVAE